MNLNGKTIGILVAPGFDDSQVVKVAQALRNRGAGVLAIGLGESEAVAVAGRHGSLLKPDKIIARVKANDLDAVIIPGGESVVRIRPDERALTLLLDMNIQEKPIGAMCNASAVLASAGLVSDHRITGDSMIRRDLTEAGGVYVEQGIVVDHNIVTCRSPEDITHFIDAISFLLEPAPSLR